MAELTPGQLEMRKRHGYCMNRRRALMDDGGEPEVNHDCFLKWGHVGDHCCATGCDYTWPNEDDILVADIRALKTLRDKCDQPLQVWLDFCNRERVALLNRTIARLEAKLLEG